jgi:hypothetical protein
VRRIYRLRFIDDELRIPHEAAGHLLDRSHDVGGMSDSTSCLAGEQFDPVADLPDQAPEAGVFEQAPFVVCLSKNKTHPNNVRQRWCDKPSVDQKGTSEFGHDASFIRAALRTLERPFRTKKWPFDLVRNPRLPGLSVHRARPRPCP